MEGDGGPDIRQVVRGRRGEQGEEAAGAGAIVRGGDEFDGDGEGGTVLVEGGGGGLPAALGVEVAADFRAEAAGVIGLEEAVETVTGEFAGWESEEFFRCWVEAGDASAVVEHNGWDGEIVEPRAGAGGGGGAGGDGGDVADDEAELLRLARWERQEDHAGLDGAGGRGRGNGCGEGAAGFGIRVRAEPIHHGVDGQLFCDGGKQGFEGAAFGGFSPGEGPWEVARVRAGEDVSGTVELEDEVRDDGAEGEGIGGWGGGLGAGGERVEEESGGDGGTVGVSGDGEAEADGRGGAVAGGDGGFDGWVGIGFVGMRTGDAADQFCFRGWEDRAEAGAADVEAGEAGEADEGGVDLGDAA